MTFSPAELVLLVALVLTSVCVLVMYRKLDVLSATQLQYRQSLADSAAALEAANDAMATLSRDGQALVRSLCLKIDEAQALLVELEDRPAPRSMATVTPIRIETGRPRSNT